MTDLTLRPRSDPGGQPGRWMRMLRSDLLQDFLAKPSAIVSALVCVGFCLAAALAPWLAQQNPYDPATFDLLGSELPPAWLAGGSADYPLGTDDQGRSVGALILYGLRISLLVGLVSIGIAMLVGTAIGLLSGYVGGWLDAALMRIADVQLSFPPILIALLVDGLARALLPVGMRDQLSLWVVIFAIGFSKWVLFARAVRGSVLVEKEKEYVQAATLLYRHPLAIMVQHVLPNALGPVLVLGAVNFSMAILTEATLSFLGAGLPPTTPSLGTLIKIGNEFIYSGIWWVTIFPGLTLIAVVFAFNILGDWLRDALNPRLR